MFYSIISNKIKLKEEKSVRLAKTKRFIADIIEPKKKANPLSIIYNILMSLVIITSCVFVFIELFALDNEQLQHIADIVEYVSVGIFAFEYLLKLFVSEVLFEGQGWWKSKLSYITSFDSFIDIICILSILFNQIPSGLAALRLLKLIKLVRLVKLKDAIDEIKNQNEKEVKEEKAEKKGFRYRIYEIIYRDEHGDKLSIAYDVLSVIIILLSISTIILDTFPFPATVKRVIYVSEIVFTIFFVTDYILRVWTADYEYPDSDKDHAKMRYIFSFIGIIDILSIIPIFFTLSPDVENTLPESLAILKLFKLFRIARLLKMSSYMNSIQVFATAIKAKRRQIIFSIVVLLVLLVLCSILLYSFEATTEDSQFENGFSGIAYFAQLLAGLSGDDALAEVHTLGGKIMLAVMLLCGGCVIGVPIGIISDEFTNIINDEKEEKDDLFEEFSKGLTNEQKLDIIAKYHQNENSEENKE